MPLTKKLAMFIDRPMLSYTVLAIFYVLLVLILPAGQATMREHSLTTVEYRIIRLSIAVTYLISWFVAFYGYKKLMDYAQSIKKTREGEAFRQLTVGCIWLAWSLPLSVIVSTLLNAISNQWDGFRPAAIILSNYLALLMPLIGFTIIGTAARSLAVKSKLHPSLMSTRVIIVAFLLISVVYSFVTFHRFDINNLTSTDNPYFLPVWVTIVTVMVPYLYAWFTGLFATYEISMIGRQARGVLYRNALGLLVAGLATVIISSIALQYVFSFEPRVGYLTLDYRFMLILLFRLLAGIGFALIALGAIRLKKIEEI